MGKSADEGWVVAVAVGADKKHPSVEGELVGVGAGRVENEQ